MESPGGYECSCSNGYALGGDGVTCEGTYNNNNAQWLATKLRQ